MELESKDVKEKGPERNAIEAMIDDLALLRRRRGSGKELTRADMEDIARQAGFSEEDIAALRADRERQAVLARGFLRHDLVDEAAETLEQLSRSAPLDAELAPLRAELLVKAVRAGNPRFPRRAACVELEALVRRYPDRPEFIEALAALKNAAPGKEVDAPRDLKARRLRVFLAVFLGALILVLLALIILPAPGHGLGIGAVQPASRPDLPPALAEKEAGIPVAFKHPDIDFALYKAERSPYKEGGSVRLLGAIVAGKRELRGLTLGVRLLDKAGKVIAEDSRIALSTGSKLVPGDELPFSWMYLSEERDLSDATLIQLSVKAHDGVPARREDYPARPVAFDRPPYMGPELGLRAYLRQVSVTSGYVKLFVSFSNEGERPISRLKAKAVWNSGAMGADSWVAMDSSLPLLPGRSRTQLFMCRLPLGTDPEQWKLLILDIE